MSSSLCLTLLICDMGKQYPLYQGCYENEMSSFEEALANRTLGNDPNSLLCCLIEQSLVTLDTWNVPSRSGKHIFSLVFILIWINSNLNSPISPGATTPGSRDVKHLEPRLELWACYHYYCNAENHPNRFPRRPQTPLRACSCFALWEWFNSFILTAIIITLSQFMSP